MQRSKRKAATALLAAAAGGGFCGIARADLAVAESLLVDLREESIAFDANTVVGWENLGALGGIFTSDPLAAASVPLYGNVGGKSNVVTFTGNDAMVSDVLTPAGLTGTPAAPPDPAISPTRTIETWAYNPFRAGEEAMVSFGRRGGPNGSAMQFNFGTDNAFGAVTHWGAPDLGWGTGAGGPPSAFAWHHLAYTFDGTTTRVYIDGTPANSETLAAGAVLTHPNFPFRLGASLNSAQTGLEIFASLSLARVRVHDGVLTAEEVLNNYNEEKADFPGAPLPPAPAQIPSAPKHRYSFDGTGGEGAVLVDSISGANGVLRAPDTSALTGTGQMRLAGGAQATAGYGDLPNQLISSLGQNATFESWVTIEGVRNWARIFDFGSNTTGELTGPGGTGNGDDYIILTASRGTNGNQQRTEIANNDAVGGGPAGNNIADSNLATNLNQLYHMVVVYDADGFANDGTPQLLFYRDGQLITGVDTSIVLQNLNDENNFLGRSNFTGDNNFQGLYEEFRIYDYALSQNQVLGNFQAGFATINLVPEPGSLLMLSSAAMLLLRRRSIRA